MNDRSSAEGAAAGQLALGRCTLDLVAGELLTAEGELAGLRRQALDVLLVLGRRAGQVVSKDELMSQVWPKVVVGEGSLTQAIADVRRVLGDEQHRLVRTVARRGYLLVPDERAALADAAVAAEPAAVAPQPVQPPPRRWAAGVGAVVLTLLLAGGAWMALRVVAAPWLSPADLARTPLPREVPALSIIVLPLAVEGDATDAQWLADALHGDLVNEVARLHDSHVIARDTAASYKGKAVEPRQVAREMGVRHVVRGSLRQEGTRIRLSLALIDGETGVQRWAESFDSERAALAQTVGDFAVAIERTLAGALIRATAERRATLSPAEVSADDLAMQGFALWYRGITRDNVVAARALFDRALALNPDSARAWAGVHFTSVNLLLNSWTDDRAGTLRRVAEAMTNLERLERDGHFTYSAKTFALFQQRDFPAMLRHTTEYVARYRVPIAFGGHGVALIFNGRFDDAVPVLERALRLGSRDPFRAEWQYRLALAHFGAARYELARDWSLTALNTTPTLVWPPIHAAALLRLGQRDAAQRAFDDHMARHPSFVTAHILARMPSEEPAYVEMRTRLVASLRELGLRD